MTADTPSAEALAAAVAKIREALADVPDEAWEFGSYARDEIRVGPAGRSKHEAFAVMVSRASIPWDACEESREAFNAAAYITACDPATIRTLLAALDAAQAAAQAPLTLATAPIGTKAPHVLGGYWVRVAAGWKWCTGSTFPRPGGDWTGELIPPEAAAQAAREVPKLTPADIGDIINASRSADEGPTVLVRRVESRVRELCGVAP